MNQEPLPQIHLIRDTDLSIFAYELHIFAGDFLRECEFNMRSLATNTGADSIAIMGKNHMWLSDALFAYCSTADKAFYSLDRDEGIEREILQKPLNPAEIWEQRQMTELIYKGLSKLPVKQRQRIYAHFFLGMSKTDIARAEGTDASSVRKSINRGLHQLKKYFEKI